VNLIALPDQVEQDLPQPNRIALDHRRNHDIAQARDGQDALSQRETADPGLIICDISMQPMDGLEFVEALRRHSWPRAGEVPVIFLTSHTEGPIVKQAFRLGVEAYVVKPVQKKQLEVRVMTTLERVRARRP
jgi:two-component system chemotaxis response regulator CheY